MTAYKLRHFSIKTHYLWIGLAAFTVACQVGVHKVTSNETRVVAELKKNITEQDFLFYDMSRLTNIVRYINPMTITNKKQSDISNLSKESYMQQFFESHETATVILSMGTSNAEKLRRSDKIKAYLDAEKKYFKLKKQEEISVNSELMLIIYKLSPK